MEYTAAARRVQHLYDTTANELYDLALNLSGNAEDALLASVGAFARAFDALGNKGDPDTDRFGALCVRNLYKAGRRFSGNVKQECQTPLGGEKIRLLRRLDRLSYKERFVFLLYCCRKQKTEHIARTLRLPKFLVSRRLFSAARKLASCGLENGAA